MAEFEGIQTKANKAIIKIATAVAMVLRETFAGPRSGMNTASLREEHKGMAD